MRNVYVVAAMVDDETMSVIPDLDCVSGGFLKEHFPNFFTQSYSELFGDAEDFEELDEYGQAFFDTATDVVESYYADKGQKVGAFKIMAVNYDTGEVEWEFGSSEEKVA